MEVRGRFDLDSVEAVGHVIGVIAIVVGVGGLALSIALAEGFVLQQGTLSELGDPDRGIHWLFNGTLVVSGALSALFFATLISRFRDRAQRVGTAVMATAGVALAAVGLFPVGHVLHTPFAAGFFAALSLGILLTAYGDHRAGRTRRARVALNLVLLHAVAWGFGYAMLEGLALPQLVGAFIFAIWVGLLVIQRGRDLPT